MTAKIHKEKENSMSILDYSERKVAKDVADRLAIFNSPGQNIFDLTYSIQKLEMKADRNNISHRSFHLTLNPGPGEDMDNEKAISLAKEVMKKLGYERQPWIIYRHRDIERIHYHIVSTRATQEGKLIPQDYIGLNLMKALKELGPKYGFVYGKNKAKTQELQVNKLNPQKGGLSTQIRSIFSESLKYAFRDIFSFSAILESKGLNMFLKRQKNGQYKVIFQGVDNGRKITNKVSFVDNEKIRMFDRINENINTSSHIAIDKSRKEFIEEVMPSLLKKAKKDTNPEKKFAEEASKYSFHLLFKRNPVNHIIEDYILIDEVTKAAVRAGEVNLNIPLSVFNENILYKGRKTNNVRKQKSSSSLIQLNWDNTLSDEYIRPAQIEKTSKEINLTQSR